MKHFILRLSTSLLIVVVLSGVVLGQDKSSTAKKPSQEDMAAMMAKVNAIRNLARITSCWRDSSAHGTQRQGSSWADDRRHQRKGQARRAG
jgi:hypothetical protein